MNNVEDVKKYIRNLGFDIDLEIEIYKEAIKYFLDNQDVNGLIHYISQLQNCGGYALEIPACIWPVQNYTFEEKVLRILELYPFVRLLSTGEIKDNEYLVLYRAKKGGHHFIKIKDGREIVEKNGCELPKKFDSWSDDLKDAPEAVFAVVKQEYRDEKIKNLPQCNTTIYLDQNAYEYEENGYKDICKKTHGVPATFEIKLQESYNNKKSSFIYNNKTFYLKHKKGEDLIYICDENKVLGMTCTDGETFIIEIEEENKNEIYGFEAPVKSLIKNNNLKDDSNNEIEK